VRDLKNGGDDREKERGRGRGELRLDRKKGLRPTIFLANHTGGIGGRAAYLNLECETRQKSNVKFYANRPWVGGDHWSNERYQRGGEGV